MKKKMKKNSILSIIGALAVGFGATSCDDYLDVNHNVDGPAYVDAYLYLPQVFNAFYNVYGDGFYTQGLTKMTTHGGDFASHYYSKASDTGGGMWRMTYWSHGMNLENIINQSIEEKDYHLAGAGLILKAISWDYSCKYNAEMPLKDAFVPGSLKHNYDYQEYIFMQIREWCKQGIAYLEMEDKSSLRPQFANYDQMYGGDAEKWKKFGYAVIVRNLVSLTKKTDFKEKYYPELMDAASKSFTSVDDDATIMVAGGGADSPDNAYNNYYGVYRGNLTGKPNQYAIDIMTGMVLKVDEENNQYVEITDTTRLKEVGVYKYELAEKQIITDTLVNEVGHWDPRVVAKLETVNGSHVANFAEIDSIKAFKYNSGRYGEGAYFMSGSDYYGATTARNGQGRWLYRNDAPYILTTYAELMYNVAEAEMTVGNKSAAFEAWKKAVAADMAFTAKYLVAGSTNITNEKTASGKYEDITFHVGDKITKAQFEAAAAEYLAGPFVGALAESEFSMSHIMMQKYVHLFPWGSQEAWVDMRKNHYDLAYEGNEYGVPSLGDGWDKDNMYNKYDSDPTKVYKGFYLPYSQLSTSKVNEDNNGSPCYRVRPRYNSEYMWNLPSLKQLKPISGDAKDYHCSMPWFCYPGVQPGAPTYDEVAE